jgi:hypothetical protein
MSRGIVTLHRYFIWANRMRTHFDWVISNGELAGEREIESFLYMSYWYGGLYVVIEGWRKLMLTDTVIDGLLQSPNVELLRRYRNGVFHFQPEYNDQRFLEFMEQGVDEVNWVRSVNEQFGRYFLESGEQLEAAEVKSDARFPAANRRRKGSD